MIRALEIPGLQAAPSQMVEASPSVAAAPAAALGNVAAAIGSVSDTFAGIAGRIQDSENARAESEARQAWLQGWGQLQADLLNEPDPARHIARTREFLEQQRGGIDSPDLAPVVRDRLRLQYDDFATRALNASTANAAELSNRRARLALDNEFDAALRTGNRAAFDRAKSTALENGVILPEQAAKLEADFNHTATRNAWLTRAAQDPAGFLAEAPEDPPDGLNALEWQDIRDTGRRSLARETSETSAEILDGITTGNITTPEQIEELTPNLRPAARERLKQELAVRADAAAKAVRATPGYQASTVAKVEEMLDTYTVDTDGFDTAYVEMDTMVRSLPSGAVKDELSRRLSDARAGQERQIETAADLHRAALTDLTKQGAFGTGTVQKPLQQILADGILRDPKKLEARGFTPEQAAQIAAAETEPQRVQLFRDLSKERAGFDQSTPYERAAFDAIQSGKTGFVEVEDLAAREKARRAAGHAKTKLEQWLKLNPNATEQEGREALLRITGETAIPGAVESILSRPPEIDATPMDDLLPPPPDN